MPGCTPASAESRNSPRSPSTSPLGAEHHAFGDAEAHLARLQVRDHHDDGGRPGPRGDRRRGCPENTLRRSPPRSSVSLQQLVGAVDGARRQHARDPQVELREVVDRDLGAAAPPARRRRLPAGACAGVRRSHRAARPPTGWRVPAAAVARWRPGPPWQSVAADGASTAGTSISVATIFRRGASRAGDRADRVPSSGSATTSQRCSGEPRNRPASIAIAGSTGAR